MAPHRADQAVASQDLPVGLGSVLRSAIGVVNASAWRTTASDGILRAAIANLASIDRLIA